MIISFEFMSTVSAIIQLIGSHSRSAGYPYEGFIYSVLHLVDSISKFAIYHLEIPGPGMADRLHGPSDHSLYV